MSTTDTDAAKRFYTGLFGWDHDDRPIPEDGVYTMLLRDGKEVAALFSAQPGMPTSWNSYVTVESADSTAATATDVGGSLMAEPPMDVPGGRILVVQDPQGAIFGLFAGRFDD
ncbi:MAG: VOC family protein [Thermoleophilaceae bacterium]